MLVATVAGLVGLALPMFEPTALVSRHGATAVYAPTFGGIGSGCFVAGLAISKYCNYRTIREQHSGATRQRLGERSMSRISVGWGSVGLMWCVLLMGKISELPERSAPVIAGGTRVFVPALDPSVGFILVVLASITLVGAGLVGLGRS
jgi:hypothetical protein